MADVNNLIGSVDFGGASLGFLKWLIWPLLLFGLVYAIYYLFSFNIRVNIFNPYDRHSIKESDRAKAVRDRKSKQVKTHKLMKNKDDWVGIIPGRFLVPSMGLFRRIVYEVYMIRDEEKNLQPIRPPSNKDVHEWEGMSSSDIQWAFNVIDEGHSVYMKQSFWAQHGATLLAVGGFLVVGVVMLVLFKQLDVLAAAFNSAADKAAQAIAVANTQVIS